jgi:phenylalanyl-tRNA synthetase alpha chain
VPVPLEPKNANVTQRLLDLLDSKDPLHTSEDLPDVSQAEVKAALDRLASRSMVEYATDEHDQAVLTPEAEGIVAQGSHEYKVWDAVRAAGKIAIKELPVGICLCGWRRSRVLTGLAEHRWRGLGGCGSRQCVQE